MNFAGGAAALIFTVAVKQNISDAISGCYQDEMAGLDAAVNIASEFAAKLRGGR
ncbi:hypothetical protein NLN86_13535 [Citrobacter portucalensis]|uniref:Uncharacterized protein n=1 Tax=Citrobacter portucalensis TaxID=1639133 RepID=A0AAW5W247_9ENTR|nr:hypothetical protein [Citrobacter portucalensis]MCX9002670.1 hypothetical protein [Citrobacter portucalensis]